MTTEIEEITLPGFQFAAIESGIRGKKRLDIGLICCDTPAAAAAVFTENRVKAAPVLLGMERLANGQLQAVMVNSGIANACTGEEGLVNARQSARLAADSLGLDEEDVLVASTGVIGQQLDMACFERGVPALASALGPENLHQFAQAIMTTDTVEKVAKKTCQVDGRLVTLVGVAKGAGMIMPNMATMLSFIMTDAVIDPAFLRKMLKRAVDQSFNRITVDGDSSTNDTVLLLAGGRAANTSLERLGAKELLSFESCLNELCLDLALQIVADGEGAGKLVTIQVRGARNAAEADKAARTIANSPLVKTAFFGQDANWGRIIAALGRSGAAFEPDRVDIAFDDVAMVAQGLFCGAASEEAATKVLSKDRFSVSIDLNNGDASGVIYTCDFSIDYVKINADYRT